MLTVRTSTALGFLSIFLLGPAPTVLAQSEQDSVSESFPAPHATDSNEDSHKIGNAELKQLGLEPSFSERLLRSWQYQFQLQEQPAVIVATSGGTTQPITNPSRWLLEHSIALQLSEWFPRSNNLPSLIQTAYDSYDPDHQKSVVLREDICGKNPRTALQCLASGGSWWGRLFSGASLTFSVSQRDEVQQGVLTSTLSAGQGWAWGGQLDFDPASLFLSSANWKSAASVLIPDPSKGGRKIYVGSAGSGAADDSCIVAPVPELKKDSEVAACVKQFTKPTFTSSLNHPVWADFAAVAIPKFQLKVLSQFDFIKQGGVLEENPLLQRSLKNITFTWDLRRLIAPTTDRIAIGATYGQALKAARSSNTKTNDNSKGSEALCPEVEGRHELCRCCRRFDDECMPGPCCCARNCN